MEKTKLVKITQNGPIMGLPGGIIGPILTPHRRTIKDIVAMLKFGTKVAEVTPTGDKELTLDGVLNVKEEAVKETVKPEAKDEPKVEKPVEAKVEETVVEEATEKVEEKQQNKNNKNNRNNRSNNQKVEDAKTKK